MTQDPGGGASRSTEYAAGSSAATDVSLRELVTMMVGYERMNARLLIGAIVAFVMFAWSQIQRRLEILNHENARLLAQQEKTVSDDTYKANEEQRKQEQANLSTWRHDVDAKLNRAVDRDEFARETKVEKKAALDTTTKVLGSIFAAILVALTLLSYQALDRPVVVTPTVTTPTVTTTDQP